MLGLLSQRLLPVLQLTRTALVFTAIADAQCMLLLQAYCGAAGGPPLSDLLLRSCVPMAIVSIGLYGFGMSLNDIIDRRRDRQIAAYRPLPSGRLGVATAHVICILLAAAAMAAGVFYVLRAPGAGWMSLVILVWTAGLIVFYDFAGKYLVGPGLLALGLIRFSQAIIPAPHIPAVWQPLLLLNHVTILSAVAYRFEAKRPRLTRLHYWSVFWGLIAADIIIVAAVFWGRCNLEMPWRTMLSSMGIRPGLLLPLTAALVFHLLARRMVRRAASLRLAGQSLMLYGLLWLIVYDAAFAAGYVGLTAGLVLLALWPVAFLSVQAMRWWSRLVALARPPAFRRAQG